MEQQHQHQQQQSSQHHSEESLEEATSRCAETLKHAWFCKEFNCFRETCRKMKKVIIHHKRCQLPPYQCLICKQFSALCNHHAKECTDFGCGVPLCESMKLKFVDVILFPTNNRNDGRELWNDPCKDFSFVAENGEIKVHKAFIFSQIPALKSLIDEDSSNENNNKKLEFHDYPLNVIEIAIKYCYGLEINEKIAISDTIFLFEFAHKFGINDLKADMENILLENITDDKICDIANASAKLNAINLNEKCIQFLSKKPQEFIVKIDGSLSPEFKRQLETCKPQNQNSMVL